MLTPARYDVLRQLRRRTARGSKESGKHDGAQERVKKVVMSERRRGARRSSSGVNHMADDMLSGYIRDVMSKMSARCRML